MLSNPTLPVDPRFLLVGLVVLALFCLLVALWRRKPAPEDYPYRAVDGLFSANERDFLRVLERTLPEHRIFAKVRLADVITVKKGLPKSDWQRAFNRISSKHLDFVICDRDLDILCAVELDDRSHERSERRARDAFLEAALHAAQVPLVRVPSRKTYDVGALATLLPFASRAKDKARTTPVERMVDVGAEAAQVG